MFVSCLLRKLLKYSQNLATLVIRNLETVLSDGFEISRHLNHDDKLWRKTEKKIWICFWEIIFCSQNHAVFITHYKSR